MVKSKKGYVRDYDQKNGCGFCLVYNLEKDKHYSTVFFHISDVSGYKGVNEREHILHGNVVGTSKGWKMVEIEATYDPDAWDSRPMRPQKQNDESFSSKQSKRLPPSLKKEDQQISDEKFNPHHDSSNKKDKERDGGYWKGDKYITK